MKLIQLKSTILLILSLTISPYLFSQDAKISTTRNRQKFNENWKFTLSDSTLYANEEFDDSKWRVLDLPHDWSIEFNFSEKNSGRNAWLPGGVGWYRKTIFISKEQESKEFKIEFDGVYKNATLWVNGYYVGNQHDGFTSFYYNITPYLNFGGKNTFALKVDNSKQPNCRWYTGSGIYRNVWLTSTNKLAIDQWGTFITTPKVSNEEAEILIESIIKNYDEASKFILETRIYNPKREEIALIKTNAQMNRKTSKTISQKFKINSPQLWSVSSPKQYLAITNVIVNNEIVDSYKTKFGIRSIKFDAQNGFFLNGENLKLKGVCLHNDGGVLGVAVPIEIWERRLGKLKEIGCNAIRAAHNPPSPEFLDLCDSIGFLVMDEFVDKWNSYGVDSRKSKGLDNFFNPSNFGDPYFEFEWKKNYKSTVLRDRNHPSIIIWSVGNENHPPESEEQAQGLREYTSFVRGLDNTRPVISGMERGLDTKDIDAKVEAIINTCKEMDLIALNYGEQWCKVIGEKKTGMPYLSTESYRYFNSTPTKRFANVERSPWLDVIENKHNMGLFLWVGVDYLGESRKFPKIGSNSGLLNSAGFRKAESYLYQAFWSEKPMVRIAVYEDDADDFSKSGRWGWPAITESWNFNKNEKKDIVTYSNCESVNLYLNGNLIGNKKLVDFSNWIMKWKDIAYKEGILKAVGLINGKEVCEFELNTTNPPKAFNFKTFGKQKDIVQVEVTVVDNRNNLINHIEKELSFEVEGDAEIIGLSNGDVNDTTSASNTKTRKTHNGKCLVILKVNNTGEAIKLVVTSKSIKKGTLKIR